MPNSKYNLKLFILPGKNPPLDLIDKYTTAFLTWKTVWEEAAAELSDFPDKLYSNDFTRQDEILAVFRGSDCTSLGFWTEMDMTLITSKLDQYFQMWDDESFAKLTMHGKKIGKYSYFTVSKPYRSWSREVDVSLTDLQVGLFGYRLLDSNCSAMTGTTRNNRKINLVCERGGAQLLKKGLVQHGCEIDLMAWYRHTTKPYFQIEPLAKDLWINRVDYKHTRRNNVSRATPTLTL
jgi:hypothetical protein